VTSRAVPSASAASLRGRSNSDIGLPLPAPQCDRGGPTVNSKCAIANPYFDNSRNTVDNGRDAGHITVMKIDDAAAHLEALGNPTRLKIYRTLIRAGEAGMAGRRLQW